MGSGVFVVFILWPVLLSFVLDCVVRRMRAGGVSAWIVSVVVAVFLAGAAGSTLILREWLAADPPGDSVRETDGPPGPLHVIVLPYRPDILRTETVEEAMKKEKEEK